MVQERKKEDFLPYDCNLFAIQQINIEKATTHLSSDSCGK